MSAAIEKKENESHAAVQPLLEKEIFHYVSNHLVHFLHIKGHLRIVYSLLRNSLELF